MKNSILLLSLLTLVLIGCNKEEIITEPEPFGFCGTADPYSLPNQPDSYFVYHWTSIDSTGTESPMSLIDTTYIIGDTTINGNQFTVYWENFMGGQYNYSYKRDSLGYIVSPNGYIYYTYSDFGTPFNHSSQPGFWDQYSIALENPTPVTVPAGTFSTFIQQLHLYSPTGAAITDCGDSVVNFNYHYASGIGQISAQTEFFNLIQTACSYRERKLVDYYIP
ncbi:MAG: hypothetical protein QNK23_08965 [Crocinitomicaceae bacterium]|nr:hypothetical protein [Crocinitomicaceae bacterium]